MSNAFLILNYNSAELTIRLARLVSGYSSIDEIIIVDNCSTDDSFSKLNSVKIKKISVYKTDYNGGYSYGNNYGVKICKNKGNDIVFIANPDVLVSESAINRIIDSFVLTNFSLLTCLQYEMDGSLGNPPILRRNSYLIDLLDCFFLGRVLLKKFIKNIDISDPVQRIDMFRGSFFAVKIDDFIQVGGFDENVFLYCEERVLSKRFFDAKKEMGIITNEKYDHMHSMSINKEYPEIYSKMSLMYKSSLYYNQHYNKINKLEYLLLVCAMRISLFEFKLRDAFKEVNR